MDKRTGYPDDWPLEPDRKFDSEFFTEEELTAKQQDNSWLRKRDAEDGVYTEYPTSDYSYTYYECISLDELKRCFLYGNWAIRQCFTYRNLAFVNQVNAGDEWWTLKKFEDGRLLAFESVTFCAVIAKAPGYFEAYIAQLLKASYDQCQRTEYTDEEFNEKYRAEFHNLRVNDARELQERMTK